MTCAKGYHKNIPQNHIKKFKYFPCEDKESCNISVYFEEAIDFIKESLAETNVIFFYKRDPNSLHCWSQSLSQYGTGLPYQRERDAVRQSI